MAIKRAGVFHIALAVAAAGLLAGAAYPLQARAQPESSTRSTTFDNWVLTCATRTDKDNKTLKSCEVRTSVVVQDEQTKQAGVAAVVAIGQTAGSGTTTVVAQVPLAAALKVPVRLTGSDVSKPIVELTYSACQAQGCQATGTATPEQLAAIKGVGEKLTLIYVNLAGQTVRVNASTQGLVAAFDALGKENLVGNSPAGAAGKSPKK